MIEVLAQALPGRNDESHEKPIRIADTSTEFRSENLPNTSLWSYRYVNALDQSLCQMLYFVQNFLENFNVNFLAATSCRIALLRETVR
jgi:hypothetical protein